MGREGGREGGEGGREGGREGGKITFFHYAGSTLTTTILGIGCVLIILLVGINIAIIILIIRNKYCGLHCQNSDVEHIYDDVVDVDIADHTHEQLTNGDIDDNKAKDMDTYERVPNVDIARILDENKAKDTYERVPDVDIARILDGNKAKDSYECVPDVEQPL